jgi:hypothetical protein
VTSVRRARILLLALVLTACAGAPSSGGESATEGQANGGASDDGSGQEANLCDAVTEELAVAALGGAVSEPEFGDVLPRPAGIYCHYALAADANVNVEVQLNEMTREGLEALAVTLLMDQPLDGVGEVAFQRASSIMGLPGVSIAAWADGRGVTVSINGEGDPAAQLAAASAIAEAALAS